MHINEFVVDVLVCACCTLLGCISISGHNYKLWQQWHKYALVYLLWYCFHCTNTVNLYHPNVPKVERNI